MMKTTRTFVVIATVGCFSPHCTAFSPHVLHRHHNAHSPVGSRRSVLLAAADFPSTADYDDVRNFKIIHKPTAATAAADHVNYIHQSVDDSEIISSDPPEDATAADSDDEARLERLRKARLASNLLARRIPATIQRAGRSTETRSTSVGARRVGSATRSRAVPGVSSTITDALRRTRGGSSPKSDNGGVNSDIKQQNDDANIASSSPAADANQGISHNNADNSDSRANKKSSKTPLLATTSVIQSTVLEMLDEARRGVSIGLFGSPVMPAATTAIAAKTRYIQPGLVLAPSKIGDRSSNSRVSVRVATLDDDFGIASLRLSVFTDCSAEMRRSFCSRSCQVLASRRNRGAMCTVATIPRYGSPLTATSDIILGTAECSFHEFLGTELGQRRLPGSLLYITEVAVNPTVRKKGIGAKLMASFDELADIQGIETFFLHVDVTNQSALSLYEKAGYRIANANDDIFFGFTKSLNLHDGATKGRKHHLMFKNFRQPIWLDIESPAESALPTTQAFGILA